MGFLSYLQRRIISLIRPWLLRKDLFEPVLLHFGLWEIALELQPIELDCGSINSSSLLSSSPFLLRTAFIDHAKLTISFFRSPGVFLAVDGVHFVFDTRPAEDSFWGDRQKQIAHNHKMEAVFALDPQGASIHAAAERHAKKEAKGGALRTFFLGVVLQAFRIELQNASTEHHLNAMDGSIHVYAIHLESLVLEEENGLAGAGVRRLASVFSPIDQTLCKLGAIQKMGLQLAIRTKEEIQGVEKAQGRDGSHAHRKDESEGRDGSHGHRRDGSHGHTYHKQDPSGYLLLWKRGLLNLEFQKNQVVGVEASVAQTKLQVNVSEAEAFVTDASQLQDLSRRRSTGNEMNHGNKPIMGGRDLWLRAFQKITGNSWKKLKNAVEAGVIRQRYTYTQLYVLWLLKAREGMLDERILRSLRKDFRKDKSDLKSLERDLSNLEHELPVEAIVLARSVAQQRVPEAMYECRTPASSHGSLLLSKVVTCLLAIQRTLIKVCKYTALMLRGFFNILFVHINRVLSIIGFYWLYSKCVHGMTALKYRVCSSSSDLGSQKFSSSSDLASQKSMEDPSMMEGGIEGLQEGSLPRIRSTTGVSFISSFHTGSLTFIGSSDHLPVDIVRKGSKRFSPARVQFSWGNVSVVYMSSDDVVGSQLVFGYLQGEMVKTDDKGSEGAKFLQSDPAPPTRVPERVQNYYEPGGASGNGLSIFMDFLAKTRSPACSAGEADNDPAQPFLSLSYEKPQTSGVTPDKYSDTLMCSLAVGCLNCNLNLDIFYQLGLLLAQFLGVLRENKYKLNDEHLETKGSFSTSIISEWETLYLDQLKQTLSSVVFKNRMWLLTAIDSPKLQFSGFVAKHTESNKDKEGAGGIEPVLVICLGHMDSIIWPIKEGQDSLISEKSNDSTRLPSSKTPKVWLRRPPSPQIQGDKVVVKSSRHEQIGSNGLITVHGAVLALQAIIGTKHFSLVGPMKMVWEFSLCREHFLSSFGVCEVVSVAALGSFSAIHSGVLVEDIRTMPKVLKCIAAASQQFFDLMSVRKSVDRQMSRQEDSINAFSTDSFSSKFQQIYFAVSVDIQLDKLDCTVTDSKDDEGNLNQEAANEERLYITDRSTINKIQENRVTWRQCIGVNGNVDHFLATELWFKFSWGDGCALLVSSGFEEASLFIAKVEGGRDSKDKSFINLSNDQKIRGAVSGYGSSKGNCHMVIKQGLLNIRRPWFLLDTSDDVEAENTVVAFELGKLQLTDGACEGIVNKALSRASSQANLSLDITIFKDFEIISLTSRGGMLVLHTEALILLLQEWQYVLSLQSASSDVEDIESLLTSAADHDGTQESSPYAKPAFGKSLSLPLQHTPKKQLKHQRLYSAPINFSTAEEETPLKCDPRLPGTFSLELLGLYLLLAQTSRTSAGEDKEGILLEMGAVLKLQRSMTKQTVSFDISRLSVCSLQSSKGRLRSGKVQASQIPRFGSMLLRAAESSNTEDVRDSLGSPNEVPNEEVTMAKTEHFMAKNTISRMGLGREKMNDFIVENISISLELENNVIYPGGSPDGWSGSCSFLDIDVGVTTSEIKVLLALVSSLSGLPSTPKNDTVRALSDSPVKPMEKIPDYDFEVPDGSIVAVKDAQEHLYMAVETTEEKSRLIGVLHHSLVGDRALFKVKYQRNSKDSLSWFSLLSIGAKTGDGQPFRVHYRPGSALADISSTRDGPCELWQILPYKHIAGEEDGDMDVCSDLNSNLVYLVNQKSKQGLTLSNGSPMLVKKPGSPFKFKIIRSGGVIENAQLELPVSFNSAHESKASSLTTLADLPKIEVKAGKMLFTLLYETGGGKHLLPLLRGRLEDVGAVMHIQAHKFRLIGDCKFVFEYLESHVDKWSMIIQPLGVGLFYRLRTHVEAKDEKAKSRTSFFARFKKMDIAVSETSLDMILFVIGILNFAGPYTIKSSPVLATSCMVENHTGLELCCRFDNKNDQEVLRIPAWGEETFFVRNMISRRDLLPAKVLSSVSFYLEKESVGLSSPVQTSLVEPSMKAVRTQLEKSNGHKKRSGPIIVVDVSKRSEDGIIVTVSPLIRIRNASGISLELRCRRPNSDSEGAIVLLKHGDMVDDSMGAFDALNLEGELKKALSSFNLGEYLLSVRPTRPLSASNQGSASEGGNQVSQYDWSEDIKGAKPVPISGFLEKLQYGLRKSFKGRNTSDSFGTVFCGASAGTREDGNHQSTEGIQILIRSTCRPVPLSTANGSDKRESSRSVVAWQEQKELVLLPTLRVHNFLDSKVSLMYTASEGMDKQCPHEMHIKQAGQVSMYADLSELAFSVEVDKLKLKSRYVSIGEWSKGFEPTGAASSPAEQLRELEMDLDFGDDYHYAKLKLFRSNDGVLQVLIYAQYEVKNRSDFALRLCASKQPSNFWTPWKRGSKVQWPSGEEGTVLQPGINISLLTRSSFLLLRMAERSSETSSLDIDLVSGSTELSLHISHENGVTEQIQLGVKMELTEAGNIDPTRIISIGSRYIASNQSPEAVFICQDGFQEEESTALLLKAGEHISLTTRCHPGHKTDMFNQSQLAGSDPTNASICSIRFRLQENGWDWTGPVCTSALGSFSLRIRRSAESLHNVQASSEIENKSKFKFVAVDVEDESPSLVLRFRMQSADTVPYRIENALSQASIFFYQKGLDDAVTTLQPGQVVGYAWDDLSKPHKLVLSVPGTQVSNEIKLDKLISWKSLRNVRPRNGFGLQLPFSNQSDGTMQYGKNGADQNVDSASLGYEIVAAGSQRVLRVCENADSSKSTQWRSHISLPSARIEFRIPVFGITLFENAKQKNIATSSKDQSDDTNSLSPIISMTISSLFMEIVNTQKHVLVQLKVQTLNIDEKWQGAPFAAMVRVHSEDRFKKGETVLQMAAIISNQVFDPIQVKYMSVLLQAIDVNLDEETLMKLVPFYRYSLAESTSSRQFYFERLEIHPIKILASFLPGQPLADYTSAQETMRALLHSFIKVPSIRGSTVELNGVLLSHALLTFRQLAIKCAQHYSWYAMRAVYIAKGSKLLPPAFASIFDDSAASSLDVFFDPSNGSIDLQGFTLGMFNLLSEGLNKRGFSGTSRYIGNLERTMKTAGSNILFAVLTEVSDNVLKGAETGGLDGMVNGFRRGILNVSMEPSLLRTAIVKGGSSRRIKLDHSAGIDETFVEGYLQGMLDISFKQNYLKVKVVDDQVLLKNLPPSSVLIDEIMESVKDFLVREGLLSGETSTSAMHSLRRLQGDNDKRIVPAVVALSEQLFVIFAVRALRNQARSWFHWGIIKGQASSAIWVGGHSKEEKPAEAHQPEPGGGQENRRGIKGIMLSFVLSSAMAYIDGRLCRHIPNTLARRIVSGFLLSFVE